MTNRINYKGEEWLRAEGYQPITAADKDVVFFPFTRAAPEKKRTTWMDVHEAVAKYNDGTFSLVNVLFVLSDYVEVRILEKSEKGK